MDKMTKATKPVKSQAKRKILLRPEEVVSAIDSSASSKAVSVVETEHDVTIHCDKRLTIVCGKAVLVLEPDGTITIRGTSLESSSTGDHRLRGATISLN